MCGIIGALSSHGCPPEYLPLNSLHHRGPDDRGFWSEGPVALGHTRLSILDLSQLGHQPMVQVGGRYVLVFNGEIYNFLELRNELRSLGWEFQSDSDTEVLLKAYQQWGKACLIKLRGMFAFACWDSEERSLFLARDRCGEKPLYYCVVRGVFYFASEMKALLEMLPERPSLNLNSINSYFYHQYVPEPDTILQGIYKLPPAHWMRLNADVSIQSQRYWSFSSTPPSGGGNPVADLQESFRSAIRLTLRSDVPVGLALSGGKDSSLIASAAARENCQLQCFTVGYEGRPEIDERHQAVWLANRLGFPIHEIELSSQELAGGFRKFVSACDEPVADAAAYGQYSVARLASQHSIRVLLNGTGGDELFWGYPWLQRAARMTLRKLALRRSWLRPFLAGLARWKNSILLERLALSPKVPSVLRRLIARLREFAQSDFSNPDQAVFWDLYPEFRTAEREAPHFLSQDFQQRVDPRGPYQSFASFLKGAEAADLRYCELLFETWLSGNLLSLGDRVNMAWSVESRSPFLEPGFLDAVGGYRRSCSDLDLPPKYWLDEMAREMLPPEVLERKKKGFGTPIQAWTSALCQTYGEQLFEGNLVKDGIVSRSGLASRLRDYQSDVKFGPLLYKLLVLEFWCQGIRAA
jgi:asparagine synthase (glutamine-hydrolysing)